MVDEKINHIYDAVLTILARAAETGKTTTRIAEEMALARLKA